MKQNPKINLILVATYFHPKLKEIIRQNSTISFYERAFEETDLENKDFVIIATDKSEVNQNVRELAKGKGIKVNAADQPDLCDFYLGSIVNKGNLKIAISTNGKSPVLAKRIREYFTEVIPDEIEENITQLNDFRNQHKGDFKQKLSDLNKATESLSFDKSEKQEAKKYKRLVLQITLLFMFFS